MKNVRRKQEVKMIKPINIGKIKKVSSDDSSDKPEFKVLKGNEDKTLFQCISPSPWNCGAKCDPMMPLDVGRWSETYQAWVFPNGIIFTLKEINGLKTHFKIL